MSSYTVDHNTDSRARVMNFLHAGSIAGQPASPNSNSNQLQYDNDNSNKAYSNGSPARSEGATNNGSVGKKRRGSTRSRVVSNLSSEQLARKRAHDRDAQRAIRLRTKSQIATLEDRVQQLEEEQHATENESNDLRTRLHSILDILETSLRQSPLDPQLKADLQARAVGELNESARNGYMSQNLQEHMMKLSNLSLPSDTRHNHGPPVQHVAYASQSPLPPLDPLMQDHNPMPPSIGSLESAPNAAKRLALEFVLQPGQHNISMDGQSPRSEQSPMDYNHKSPSHILPSSSSSGGTNRLIRRKSGPSQYCPSPTLLTPNIYRHSNQSSPLVGNGSLRTNYPESWQTLPRHLQPTCPLDTVFLDFIEEQAKLAAMHGIAIEALAGPPSPDITLVVMPKSDDPKRSGNPLTAVLSAILNTFEERSIAIPERIAMLFILYLWMRWAINPTKEAFERMPDWIKPRASALYTPHPIWMDHMPWPKARDVMIGDSAAYPNIDFSFPYTQSLSVNWPYEDLDTVLEHAPGEFIVNPVFERHLRNLDNWSLGPQFARVFPALEPHIRIKIDTNRP